MLMEMFFDVVVVNYVAIFVNIVVRVRIVSIVNIVKNDVFVVDICCC